MNELRKLNIVIMGATATGKSAFAHELYAHLQKKCIDSAVVNLDAFQFYKGVTLGTAKPSKYEIAEFKYKGLDICEANENIDAQSYFKMARGWCESLWEQNKTPICVGGSGLYQRSFLHGLDDLPQRNDALRNFYRTCALNWGWPHLHLWLQKIDAQRALELHPNDGVRIERALEIFFETGHAQSLQRSRNTKEQSLSNQSLQWPCFVVQVDVKDDILLREQIIVRVQKMMDSGWISEVEQLLFKFGNEVASWPSMRAIGYQQIMQFLQPNSEIKSTEKLMELIAIATWQYVRRQRTWNNREHCDAKVDMLNGHGKNEAFEAIEKALRIDL